MTVKNAARTSKGYQYQSLYAAKLMIESLINENEYEKFIIEADSADIAGSAIDDIVCFNKDNKVDYYQVKHTDNLLTKSLSFDWLFDKDRKILEKLFESYKKQIKIENSEMGNIFLLTPREPSTRFKDCLDAQGFLIYENINEQNLNIIDKLFGSDLDTFKQFLKVLKFETADNYDLLEHNIKRQFHLLSGENDFDKYIRTVERWSTNKDAPSEKGIINKNNIKDAVFNKKESLNQTFNIEQDYVILNDFGKTFKEKIKKNKLIVLYGEAGTGKSSFITNFLKNVKNHIRHYYFLPHQSNQIERIDIDTIKESLKSQLKRISDADFGCSDLKEMIEIHDSNSNIKNNPFYIVIDGIDHVYRNNKENIKPLIDFFDLILSINLKNTKIIISTQMSDSKIYPELLLNKLPKEEWIEINKLTKEEVYKYIKNQNFIIKDKLKIRDVSNILYEKNKGHPLLLHYIKENFKKTNIINKESLDKIQTCETICEYYNYILSNVDGYEKDILFLMSKYDFVWYNNYLKEIINLIFEKNIINDEKELEHNNINFLFKQTFNNGFTFHHESLARYLKEINLIEKSEEKKYISTLTNWIKFKSPEHIKNIWGKMLLIENDNTFDDINYSWIAERVSEGYSLVKLKELLALCIKQSRRKKRYSEMHYFNGLLYRLKNEYNLFLADDALIEIYSNCKKEILFENLDIIYNDSLRNIYILAYTANKRNDCVLLKYAEKKFNEYNNRLKSKKIKINEVDKYYDFLFIMFSDVKYLKTIFSEKDYLNYQIMLINKIILEFRTIKEIENIYRASSKDNKKQLSLYLALHYLKNNEKTKFMYFLFDVIKKDVCLKTNTITINNKDENYFNLYFSYFLKCFYLRIKNKSEVDIEIVNNSYSAARYLSYEIKNEIKSIIDCIINNNTIDFIDIFNSGSIKNVNCEPYIKKVFDEFKILIACLIHFCNKPRDLIDINSIGFLLDDKNIEKSSILKLDDFLKINIFDNNVILNFKDSIKTEISSKIIINYLEGSETEYFSLFRFLKKYNQYDNGILFDFCKVSLSYEFNKDESIYPLIYSLSYLSDIDRENTLILLNDILPQIRHLDEFTNMSELRPAICLFNSLLDKLLPKTEKELKAVKKYLDLQNLENYKKSKLYLDYDKDEYLNNRINERSSKFNKKQTSGNYLDIADNWHPSIHFPDDFFYHVNNFLSVSGNEENIETIMKNLIYNKDSNILPYDKLVYVFCNIRSRGKALNLIKMFVKIFIEETKSLNIPEAVDSKKTIK